MIRECCEVPRAFCRHSTDTARCQGELARSFERDGMEKAFQGGSGGFCITS